MSDDMTTAADRSCGDPSRSPGGRLLSLDVFRGLTVAGMILVNNPGSWGATYAPLKHAEWDGWTPTDLVFPFFLFIVGVAIPYSLAKRRDDPEARRAAIFKVFRRSLVLFALGLFLNKFPFFRNSWREIQEIENWRWIVESIRVPGVLQRISLCYLAASILFLSSRVTGQLMATVGLLVGYWLLETYVPVPGSRAGDLTRGHDLSSYLDRLLLLGHTYKADYDPEGLLSTLPAVATTILGVLTGQWLRSGRVPYEIDAGLFVAGVTCVTIGSAWGISFPINKALWTSSFVLLTGGLAMIGLATCYWLVDLRGYQRWSYPFRVFGGNAIAAYTLGAMGARVLGLPLISRDGSRPISVHQWIHGDFLLASLQPYPASLTYALSFVLACLLVVMIMDAAGIHLKA